MSFLSKVAPVVMPEGKAVTLSAELRPVAPSERQSWGKPTRSALPVLPTQRLEGVMLVEK
jgi:hypothetical protein